MSEWLNDEESELIAVKGEVTADLRFCSFCEEKFPAAELKWELGRSACNQCKKTHTRENPIQPPQLDDEPVVCQISQINQVNEVVRCITLFGRYGLYGLGCFLAVQVETISDILHGVLMADLATWICTACFDIRDNRGPVIVELIGFGTLTTVMLHTDAIKTPSDPAAIGMAFLAFTFFFALRGTIALTQRLHGHRED